MSVWFSLPVVAVASLALTGSVTRYAPSRGLIDVPGARSSHTVPTPRGGGIAIVVCFLASLIPLIVLEVQSRSTLVALLGAGAVVGLVGLADDRWHVAPQWRLLVHVAAAAWVLSWLHGAPSVPFFGSLLDLGWFGSIIAALCLVWLVNLYNFMDGIDGIAAVEAICVCGAGAALYALVDEPSSAITPLLLTASAAGFFFWNFPPARIFMGDVGSGFLGITLGGLALQAALASPRLLWSWFILLAVFVTDATFTLVRRLLHREKAHEAHRSHAYQHAARRFGHLPVTLAVGAIDVVWLLPIAWWVGSGNFEGLWGAMLAYAPLIALAAYFKAGKAEEPAG
ncbi:MAG: glycosyl transferase [Actinobacteria bacterium RBG_16_64_13]|nr:MAG: glycosyl transferase [Actinobacteria bacterium RBG_16_64_13]